MHKLYSVSFFRCGSSKCVTMAAHISCHQNDIIPNRYPPPRPSVQDHGSMSEYGPLRIMTPDIPPTSVEVNGGMGLLQDEHFPTYRKPAPYEPSDYHAMLDPLLCLTPDHKRSKSKLSAFSVQPVDEELHLAKPIGTQRVRFDSTVDVRHLSPETSAEGSAIDLNKQYELSVEEISFEDVLGPPMEEDEDDSLAGDTIVKSYVYQVDENIDTVGDTSEYMYQSSGIKPDSVNHTIYRDTKRSTITRKVANKKPGGVSDQQYQGIPSMLGPSEHYLARPELHSTLR